MLPQGNYSLLHFSAQFKPIHVSIACTRALHNVWVWPVLCGVYIPLLCTYYECTPLHYAQCNRRDDWLKRNIISTRYCLRRRIHHLSIEKRRILSVAAFIDSIYLCFSTGRSVLGWFPSTVTFGFAACSCRCPTTMRRRFWSIMAVETRSKWD